MEYILLLTLVAVAAVIILQWGSFTTALKNALSSITGVIDDSNNANQGTTTGP